MKKNTTKKAKELSLKEKQRRHDIAKEGYRVKKNEKTRNELLEAHKTLHK